MFGLTPGSSGCSHRRRPTATPGTPWFATTWGLPFPAADSRIRISRRASTPTRRRVRLLRRRRLRFRALLLRLLRQARAILRLPRVTTTNAAAIVLWRTIPRSPGAPRGPQCISFSRPSMTFRTTNSTPMLMPNMLIAITLHAVLHASALVSSGGSWSHSPVNGSFSHPCMPVPFAWRHPRSICSLALISDARPRVCRTASGSTRGARSRRAPGRRR